MSYLFAIDKKNKVVLRPEVIKLCPELSVLNNEEILTIILTYDYYSPYNQFPEEDRKRKAIYEIYGGKEPAKFWETQKISTAIDKYKSLQYNPKIELIRRYQTNINRLNDVIDTTKDKNEIAETVLAIDKLRKYVNEMDKEIHADVLEQGVIVGNSKLSFLEIFQQNISIYNAIKK